MKRALRAYKEVLQLVRRLPPEARPYYAKYARENFVNYRDLDDSTSLDELLHRAYAHSTWVLNKVPFPALLFASFHYLVFFYESHCKGIVIF